MIIMGRKIDDIFMMISFLGRTAYFDATATHLFDTTLCLIVMYYNQIYYNNIVT